MGKMIVLLVTAVGCAGPAGPTGPAGPMGEMGTMGIQGATGAPGQNGANGQNGTNGTDGSKITASIFCGGTLENTSLSFGYSVAQFANGNVFASGDVFGTTLEGTAANIYSPAQNGYLDAPVLFTLDSYGSADGGYWRLSLDRQTLVTVIVYNDADLASGTETWTMTPDKCILNSY